MCSLDDEIVPQPPAGVLPKNRIFKNRRSRLGQGLLTPKGLREIFVKTLQNVQINILFFLQK